MNKSHVNMIFSAFFPTDKAVFKFSIIDTYVDKNKVLALLFMGSQKEHANIRLPAHLVSKNIYVNVILKLIHTQHLLKILTFYTSSDIVKKKQNKKKRIIDLSLYPSSREVFISLQT